MCYHIKTFSYTYNMLDGDVMHVLQTCTAAFAIHP